MGCRYLPYAAGCLWLVFACGSPEAESSRSKSSPSTAAKGVQDAKASSGNGSTPAAGTESNSQTSATNVALNFTADINPVIKASCGGAICHGIGSPYGEYENHETLFNEDGAQVTARLNSTNPALVMPKPGFGTKPLGSRDREMLAAYLTALGPNPAKVDVPTSGKTPTSTQSASNNTNPVPPPSAKVQKLCADVTPEQKASGAATIFSVVRLIGQKNCGGAGCHSGGLPRGFVDIETQWVSPSYGPGIITNMKSGAMPIGGRALSKADKDLMVFYICARADF